MHKHSCIPQVWNTLTAQQRADCVLIGAPTLAGQSVRIFYCIIEQTHSKSQPTYVTFLAYSTTNTFDVVSSPKSLEKSVNTKYTTYYISQ